MSYQVIVKPSAEKEWLRLPDRTRQAVADMLLTLEETPRPTGVKKLRGREGWRVRVGEYRILYIIDDSSQKITVLSIAHRRDVYR